VAFELGLSAARHRPSLVTRGGSGANKNPFHIAAPKKEIDTNILECAGAVNYLVSIPAIPTEHVSLSFHAIVSERHQRSYRHNSKRHEQDKTSPLHAVILVALPTTLTPPSKLSRLSLKMNF
jgi:hypothetical protein